MKLSNVIAFAIHAHESTNHKYSGEYSYSVHLAMVAMFAMKYRHLVDEKDFDNVMAGCWFHDTIEDCRFTYNDVKQLTNTTVADIVYALTNEKGKNRAERGNEKYYKLIRETKYAVFVKLCDRLANAKFSLENGSRMLEMYAKENDKFLKNLGIDPNNYGLDWHAEMVDELISILKHL